MGFNLIRVWGGGIAERSLFYEAADTIGILVMQDFWHTADNNDFDPSYALSPQDGPYGILFLWQFFERNPGLPGFELTPLSFQPEIGSVSTPEYESLANFLSEEHLCVFPNRGSTSVDTMWAYHKYEGYSTALKDGVIFDHIFDGWGDLGPSDTKEWVDRAGIFQSRSIVLFLKGFQQACGNFMELY